MDMRELLVDKVVVNIGVGESGEKQKKAIKVLEMLTGNKPVTTYAKRTNQTFGIKKGEAIGCKVTLRGEKAEKFLKNAFDVIEKTLSERQIGDGWLSFGIREHIDFPGVDYDPEIGIFGMDVNVVFRRRGFRVERRKRAVSKVGRNHRIVKHDVVEHIKEKYGVVVE